MSQTIDALWVTGRLLVETGLVSHEAMEGAILSQIGHRALRWPGKSLGYHLTASRIVDPTELESLLRERDHLPVLQRELRLGEIAVRNGFLTREELALCLVEQETERAEGREPLALGQIIVRDDLMWEHDLQAILERQRALLVAEDAARETTAA
jgi:hypothetical protein